MKFTLRDLYKYPPGGVDLGLKLLAGGQGLDKQITVVDINRPGLALVGYFEHFAFERLQIFGQGEHSFLSQIAQDRRREVLENYFGFPVTGCIFTHGHTPPEDFLNAAEAHAVPAFNTKHGTTQFINAITQVLEEKLAPSIGMHAVMVEVFGIGVLLVGDSGVGKSECALELIERGHRLIADDIVEIKCVGGHTLIGQGSEVIQHHMEIRGLGIISVKDIFGAGAVRSHKHVDLVVSLEVIPTEEEDVEEIRLGLKEKTHTILNVAVPKITIPVKPGRNIPIIVETAAMNERLKRMGYFSAREFNKRLLAWLDKEKGQE